MMKLRVITFVMVSVVLVGAFAPPVHAKSFLEDWFSFLFEEPDTGPTPEQTGRAPFAQAGAVDTAESKQLGVDYKPHTAAESAVTTDQAHRQPAQMVDWSSQVISAALDFDPLQYDAHLGTLNQSMTPYAVEAFKAFMAKDNLLEALKGNNLVMRVFITEPARLLNQGAVQGRYRWLIESPVTISFLPRGTNDYKGIQPKSQQINIRTQVGRVAEGGIDGAIIETLEFLPVAAPK